MPRADADRNLLFGLLALQVGLIDQGQLVAAFQAWALRKDLALADHLMSRGDIDADDRATIDGLVERHLRKHGGRIEQSLAAVPATASTQRRLQEIADPDLGTSLAALDARTPVTNGEGDGNGPDTPDWTVTRVTLAGAERVPGPTAGGPVVGVPGTSAGRYQLLTEIARGGMGAVLRGRDPGLGRDLAIKVLLEQHRERRDLLDRFVEEAQICGQLQHPGIVPVYELGTLADHRPFFAMKLVKGQTLAKLLAARPRAAASHKPEAPAKASAKPSLALQACEGPTDLPRLLSIFEAVCQTMAYAHARGVIHRDLKPSNVMVGSFGEVQMMDWGLAKVLPQDGRPPEPERDVRADSVVATLRSRGDSELSHAGSVLGTPAYMAPEQARGETERIDRRADVFALGSILCEILTGAPAFSGETAVEILRDASQASTAASLERLARSDADHELLELARDCLAAEPHDRPDDAGVVAGRMTAYLAGVQERLHAVELARAAEEARAQEAEAKAVAERRARRSTRALAATVLLAGGLFTAGWRWVELDRLGRAADATARANMALREATQLHGQAERAPVGDLGPWDAAAAAVASARELLVRDVDPQVRNQVEELAAVIVTGRGHAVAAAESAARDRRLLDRLGDIHSARTDDRLGDHTDAAYNEAFREAGIDPDTQGPEEAARRIRRRPPEEAIDLALALDDWAAVRRDLLERPEDARRLSLAARLADPDPWRNSLRDGLELADRKLRRDRLVGLVGSEKDESLPADSFDLLGKALGDVGAKAEAETVLRRGQRLHPMDVWLNYDLARTLEKLGRRRDAIRYYTAARMLRPETAHELAHALVRLGETDEGISVFKDLMRLQPANGRHLLCLGETLRDQGHGEEARKTLSEAVEVLRNAIADRPNDYYSYLNQAAALRHLADLVPQQATEMLAEALRLSREAVRINPRNVQVHTSVGLGLLGYGRFEEAAEEFRNALRIENDDDAAFHGLGLALEGLGRLDEAIGSFRDAVRIEPDRADYRNALSNALRRRGRFDEALAEAREAVRLLPWSGPMLSHLGSCCYQAGRFEEARAAYREALRLQPDQPFANNALAWNLVTAPGHEKNDPREALTLARKAVALAPGVATNVNTLGICLYRAGLLDEAITTLRRSALLSLGRDASDWFFLAMAHYRRGEPGPAADLFVRGIDAFRRFPQEGHEAAPFWAEASRLFGALGPGAASQHR